MIDYILIAIILVIVAAAAFYVYKAKKAERNVLGVRMAVRHAMQKRMVPIAAAASINISNTGQKAAVLQ